ncbi:MAG: hypothetical protein ACE5GO_07850, partial [Anaerolineales bacterium]
FMLMVRQNLLENCKDGIIIDPKWDPKNPKRVRWMVVDNIAPLATRDVIAPGSVVNINNDFQM